MDGRVAFTDVEFRILGPLQVIADDGRPVPVTGHRQQAVLGLLLVYAYQPVSLSQLVEAVWDGEPPATAQRQLQNTISALRRQIRQAGVRRPVIASDGRGYRILRDAGDIDALVFTERVARARAAAGQAGPHRTVAELRAALSLWSGPPLHGLTGRSLDAAAARLAEQRLAVWEECLDAELRLGRQRQVVDELAGLVAQHPLRERLVGQLMIALSGTGRRPEALQAYQRLRTRLADELGLDPGAELREVHAAILRGEAGAGLPAESAHRSPPAGARPVPAQLPAAAAGFTGRGAQLAELDRLLSAGEAATTVVISAIAGMAGVGKTTLAVHWGHKVRERFPDGSLYIDLRGHATAEPMPPIEALARFLPALGLAADELPEDLEAAAALYRSLLADRKLLVLLDNAATSDQVRPLLPGRPGCLALVTSRNRLAGLVAREGARPLPLDLLTADEAHRLLATVLGADRVGAEPDGAAALARACGHLPLALRVAAAALLDQPAAGIAEYAAALHRGDRLAGLTAAEEEHAGVRHAFDLSYQALPAPERTLFRLLGLIPTVDITAEAAAALADISPTAARRLLDRLAGAHLVTRPAPGRYGLHDLLRRYAADRAAREDGAAERRAAPRRLSDWYLLCADAAARRLYPQRLRLPVPVPSPRGPVPFDAEPAPGTDPARAVLDWLDAERANLVATIRHTAAHGPRPATWLLADTLRGYFWLGMHTRDWTETAQLALAAAEAEGDPQAQAAALLSVGDTADRRNDRQRAIACYTRALELCEVTGWVPGQIAALGKLGVGHYETGRLREAVAYYERALALCRQDHPDHSTAVLLGCLGSAYRQRGDLDQAAGCQTRALAIFRKAGARQGEAAALDALGDILSAQGRLAEAEDHLTRALALEKAMGDRGGEAYTLRSLAAVHQEAGRCDQAMELALAAMALARETADRRIEADTHNTLGSVHHQLGRIAEAREHHQRALDLCQVTGYRYTEVEARLGLAGALTALGQADQAHHHAARALRSSREAGFGLLAAVARTILDRVATRV